MTDLRKAAEMALKALEEINKLSVGEKAICLPGEIDGAREALRQALAQTEQEPVGYINGMHGGYMVFTPINPSAVYLNGTALYTAPPKREWVGLTDEEVHEVLDDTLEGGSLVDVCRAIEAKLKEKNTWESRGTPSVMPK